MQNNDNIIFVLKGCIVAGIPPRLLQPIIKKATGRFFSTEYQFWLSVMGDACKEGVLAFADKLLGVKPPADWLETEDEFIQFLKDHPVDEYVKAALRLSHFWNLPTYEDLELEDGTPWPDRYQQAKASYREFFFRRDVRYKLFELYLPWHNLYETVDNPDELQLEQYITMFIADLEEDLQKKAGV